MVKNPQVINLTSEWAIVAQSVENITILKQDHTAVYFWQYVKSGDTEPGNITGSEMLTSRMTLEYNSPVDIYMRISQNSSSGQIRIDNHGNNIIENIYDNIARGYYPDKMPAGAYGVKVTTGADSGILWPDGVFAITPETTLTMEIFSTSIEDAATGTGIRTIEIHYIGDDWSEHDITVTLNGTNIVQIPTLMRFVQCTHLVTSGSLLAAAGNITIRATGGGAIYSYIAAGDERCTSSMRMTPIGYNCLVDTAFGSSTSDTAGSNTIIRIVANELGNHQYRNPVIFMPHIALGFQDNSFGANFKIPLKFKEKTIVGMKFNTRKASTIIGSWAGRYERT